MNDADVLAFHRKLVATPSVSHDEERSWISRKRGSVSVVRARCVSGRTSSRRRGRARRSFSATHLDTVPPTSAWTRDPFVPEVVDGRVYGLGSNDAKASAAAMTGVFLRAASHGGIPE
jgi:acetylornithine deacetylase